MHQDTPDRDLHGLDSLADRGRRDVEFGGGRLEGAVLEDRT